MINCSSVAHIFTDSWSESFKDTVTQTKKETHQQYLVFKEAIVAAHQEL